MAPRAPSLRSRLPTRTSGGATSWRSLGTYVHLRTADPGLIGPARLLARHVLDEVDRACSRFRGDSDLTRANSTGRPERVSPVLVGAVRVALEAASVTDGLVDPTLGQLLAAAGYSRTFALVAPNDPTPVSLPRRRAGWQEVAVTDETVFVPASVSLDLGATGKAYAADLVALTVCRMLPTAVVVSVGGDVRAAEPEAPGTDGATGSGTSWPVAIGRSAADIDGGHLTASVRLGSGGLATSSVTARRWARGGREWHHLFDPRTGEPASGPWVAATALGATCVAANTATTAALVLGLDAEAWLEERDVAALLVATDGRVVRTTAWTAAGLEDEDVVSP